MTYTQLSITYEELENEQQEAHTLLSMFLDTKPIESLETTRMYEYLMNKWELAIIRQKECLRLMQEYKTL